MKIIEYFTQRGFCNCESIVQPYVYQSKNQIYWQLTIDNLLIYEVSEKLMGGKFLEIPTIGKKLPVGNSVECLCLFCFFMFTRYHSYELSEYLKDFWEFQRKMGNSYANYSLMRPQSFFLYLQSRVTGNIFSWGVWISERYCRISDIL